MSSSYYIPEDIILKILSLLPAISLLRFNAVCKLWQSIISDPQFINTHLANSHKKPARVAILTNKEADGVHIPKESIRLKLPPQCNGMISFTCSCNGLICLANLYGVNICVWNPLTKLLKMIPSPKKQDYSLKWIRSNMGFGFDSVSDDYKILRMVEALRVSLDGLATRVIEAQLYSSNADCWKEIQVPKIVPSSIPCTYSKCIQLKTGVLYMDRGRDILSFDLHNEVFGVYPYPLHYKTKSSVLNFEDSLAMIFESIAGGSVSLWTLDDVCGDGKMSWTERFNLKADWKIGWVHLISGVGQFVVNTHVPGYRYLYEYFLYDYKKKDTMKLLAKRSVKDTSPVIYTESLACLKGFQKYE